jgi:RHS repeat-associated protein
MNAPTFFPKPLDYIGRRVSNQVWTRTGGAWVDEGRTAFVYDGWNLISEISNLPSQIQSSKHYVWGLDLSGSLQGAGGVGGLLAHTHTDSSGTQTFHYTYDLNGNVSEVLDGSATIAAHYEYGPFGEMLREAYQSLEVRRSLGEGGFKFSTKYHDRETGLLYYGYRYYDPTAGRWISRDPAEEEGGVNIYASFRNSPIDYIDPVGLTDQSCNSGPPPLPPGQINESLLHPGPYSGDSIPGPPNRQWTPEQIQWRDQPGAVCHSCGDTLGNRRVLDHQPPMGMNPDNSSYRLYRHCPSCSSSQGGSVRAAQRFPQGPLPSSTAAMVNRGTNTINAAAGAAYLLEQASYMLEDMTTRLIVDRALEQCRRQKERCGGVCPGCCQVTGSATTDLLHAAPKTGFRLDIPPSLQEENLA